MSNKKWDIDKVRKVFKNRNYILLTEKYINYKQKLEYKCLICGNVSKIDLGHFMDGKGCSICALNKSSERNRKYSYEDIQKIFEERNCELLTKKEEYKRARQKFKYICPYCGNIAEMGLNNFIKKCRCSFCRKNRKYTFKEVKKIFENKGCKILQDFYVGYKEKTKFRCICKNESTIALNSLLRGGFCNKCRFERMAEKQRHLYKDVKKVFEDAGCILKSKTYINSHSKLDYICVCETPHSISFDSFSRGHRCPECRATKVKNKLKLSYKDVKQYFEDHDCILVSKEYINSGTLLDYICVCKNPAKISFSHFKGGCRCKVCKIINSTGENNPCWNPNLTDEDREDRRLNPENIKWRKKIYKKYDFTCQIRHKRGGDLVAHHLESYDVNVELRFVVSNGICMGKEYHILFHKIYGYGNNTTAQFEEFLEKYQEILIS